MNVDNSSSYIADHLRNASNTVKCVRDRVKDGDSAENHDGFNLSDFWNLLTQAVTSTSQEATKISLAFSKPPLPSEQDCVNLAESVQKSALTLATVYYRLPKSQGTTLRKLVREATVEVLDGVVGLLDVIVSSPGPSLAQEQLTCTGGVWAACDQFAKLARDNRAAVSYAVTACIRLVKDALIELQQALEENDDPFGDVLDDGDDPRGNRDSYWSQNDRRLVSKCLGLVKAAGACLRKLAGAVNSNGNVDTPANVAQLDDLADVAKEISPSVDELVMSLYPPVEASAVEINVSKLASILRKTLGMIRACHVCSEADVQWVEFLEGAVEHNVQEVKTLLSQDSS
ncbi:cyclin-D1-binding protein 1 homolog isoform X2 [Trichomycterus rosablanca]|uniref:cyclin-D1-binding protein 1 homolog isoform X2 n=1 Tax=Trichomycterus rosablanca TaxID=2290929 RepID=UPI002F34F61C